MKIHSSRMFLSLLVIYSLVFAQSSWWNLNGMSLYGNEGRHVLVHRAPPNPSTYPESYSKDMQRGEETEGRFSPMSAPVKSAAPGAQSIPEPGSVVKVLIIPVCFADTGFDEDHDVQYFVDLTSELKDYYEENSQYIAGTRGISVAVTVADPVQSSQTMAYYGADGSGIDNANGNIHELAREAVTLLDSQAPFFDFGPFDRNSDGIIDHIIIIHAGDGQEDVNDPDLIWSHYGIIGEEGQATQSGKTAESYAMIAESSPLGVLAHEFGHDIGLPDLYDTDDFADGYTFGVGSWDVMGLGVWNCLPGDRPGTCPANLSAWSRMYMGWALPTEIEEDTSTLRILTNSNGYSNIYKLWPRGSDRSTEYFLVEYRRRIGYDAGLPGEGVLIWHVDQSWIDSHINENEINVCENRLGVELEQADGKWDLWYLENTGDAGDPFPGSSENDNFVALPYSLNTGNIDGSFTYVEVKKIDISGSTAYAYLLVEKEPPGAAPVLKAPSDEIITDTTPEFSWDIVYKSSSYKLQISTEETFGGTATTDFTIDGTSDNLIYSGKGYTYKLPFGQLDSGTKYYWRMAATNDSIDPVNNPGDIVWSDTRSFTTCSNSSLSAPAGLSVSPAEDRITVTWEEVDGATEYIVMTDGAEETCPVNGYIHGGLYSFTRHIYRVRAVNTDENSLGDWSDEIAAYTAGAPTIEADVSGVVEGSEDGGLIEISLSNGVFRNDGAYNRATVMLDLASLPEGIRQGEVTRIGGDTLRIGLTGNSTEDYDTDVVVPVIVTKEQVDTGRYYDLEADIIFSATVEEFPPAPDVTFSFDGPNAGSLMGVTPDMEYSLNGGTGYTEVSSNDQRLTSAQIQGITPDNDILIRLRADFRIPAGQPKVIDILPGPAVPGVIGNDEENTVTGIDNTMEFSTGGTSWTRYDNNLPDLSGNVTLRVRVAAGGTTLAGSIKTLTFTEDESGGGGGGGGFTPETEPQTEASGIHVDTESIEHQLNDKGLEQVRVSTPEEAGQQVVTIEPEVFDKLDERQKALAIAAGPINLVLPPSAVDRSIFGRFGEEAVLRFTVQRLCEERIDGIKAGDVGDLYIVDSHVYELKAEIVSGDRAEMMEEFSVPVTISVSLSNTDLNGINASRLGAYHYDETTGQWEYAGGRYDSSSGAVTFTTAHFSCYAIAELRKVFADIVDHWARDEIEFMAARHIAKGKSDSEFQPDATITRAEFTALLVRTLALKGEHGQNLPYSDVESGSWYNSELSSAFCSNVVSQDVIFRPDDAITRQEIVTMIVRALKQKGFDTDISQGRIEEVLGVFDDMNGISEYARASFAYSVNMGIIHGRTPVLLVPGGNATRAEAIVFIKRVMDLIAAV